MTKLVISNDTVTCPGCGRIWRYLSELDGLRCLGLALVGSCPHCGQRLAPVNKLWHKGGNNHGQTPGRSSTS